MRKRIIEDGRTPKFYTWDKVIMEDHVARFYGAMLAKMLNGNQLIDQIFCSRETYCVSIELF